MTDQIADLSAFAVEPEPEYQKVYNRLYSVPAFHALQHRSELMDLMERVLDAPVMPQPRLIARVIFPERTAYTTPAHQDFVPIQGAADTITAWIPLTDLTLEMGGLEIAAGSHRTGVFDFVPALGASGTEISDPLHGTWVGGTFQPRRRAVLPQHDGPSRGAGHGVAAAPVGGPALPAHRRSDLAWQLESTRPRCHVGRRFTPAGRRASTSTTGATGTSIMGEFDPQYNEKRDAMAFEVAAKGGIEARATLQRIVARDPDPAKKRKAAEALAALEDEAS